MVVEVWSVRALDTCPDTRLRGVESGGSGCMRHRQLGSQHGQKPVLVLVRVGWACGSDVVFSEVPTVQCVVVVIVVYGCMGAWLRDVGWGLCCLF